MRSATRLAIVALVASASRVVLAAPTFVVDSLVDAPGGGSLADGVCETAPGNGVCTLRAAVMEANEVPGGGATIRLPAGTYVLARPPSDFGGAEDGDLDLDAALTIAGAGPGVTIVDGSDLDRVFVSRAAPVTLRGVTIRNGRAATGKVGGGIVNDDGDLRLENVVVASNEGPAGGGVLSSGALTLRHCVVEDNRGEGGGGGIATTGATQIADSRIGRNASGMGMGGGVLAEGSLRVERSLIAQNYAELGGGGIAALDGETVVRNTTIEENEGGPGAGVYVAGGSAHVVHATVTANQQTLVGTQRAGGLAVEPGAALLLKGSVVAGNEAPDESPPGFMPSECGNGASPVLSGDYNLIAHRDACFLTGALDHVNAANLDVQLEPLAYDGGFAPDRAGTGPTLAAIPPASCTDELGAPLRDDQRGYARRGPCDIGAHQAAAGYAPDVLRGVELLRNGGGEGNELGATDGFDHAPPPYWGAVIAPLNQIVYGLSGDVPGTAPAGAGALLFEGGEAQSARGRQRVDLSALAAEIDAGALPYAVSGLFGGFQADDDQASLNVLFTNDFDVFEAVTIGGFTAADRGGVTGLLPDSAQGVVPAGARFADVTLELTRDVADFRNNGYADALSLVVPEPSGASSGAIAIFTIAALGACRRG